MSEPAYPGAVPPERSRWLDSFGLRLRVHEWGDPDRTPVVLIHGMFDHARSFDTFAPLLAQRFRVVALDARGHGDSEWAESYPWVIDVLAIVQLLRSNGKKSHLIGHSKGGGQSLDAAVRAPDDVRQVVDIDGFGPPPEGFNPKNAELPEREPPDYLGDFLDWRRNGTERSGWRAYPTLDELAARRKEQNPRLSTEWLRYFTEYGARETERGFTWKSDPHTIRGFGPWVPEWIAPGWAPLKPPLLAIQAAEQDTWGPIPEETIEHRLSYIENVERTAIPGTGHFVHIEKPEETARLVLDWLEP